MVIVSNMFTTKHTVKEEVGFVFFLSETSFVGLHRSGFCFFQDWEQMTLSLLLPNFTKMGLRSFLVGRDDEKLGWR